MCFLGGLLKTSFEIAITVKTWNWMFLYEFHLASSENSSTTSRTTRWFYFNFPKWVTLRHCTGIQPYSILLLWIPPQMLEKKDLPSSIGARFAECYVDEIVDPAELRAISVRYLNRLMLTRSTIWDNPLVYWQKWAAPSTHLCTLTRALSAAWNVVLQLDFSPQRALLEGFGLAYEGALDAGSRFVDQELFNSSLGKVLTKKDLDHPGRNGSGKQTIML
jgi:hypothetical protein